MSEDRRRGSSGPADTSLVERAEALIDEAVGQAAKGSYREAADKAEQALAIDPDNTAARDLLASYRHLVTDEEERRRRRRSLAAAAATIEEMVESDRLDEAASATDALALQFGHDAPIEELHRRIAEARATQLDFHDLDAAIDAIRRPAAEPGPPVDRSTLDPVSALGADLEEHLRSGRLQDASGVLAELESITGPTERVEKLRTRIEEALDVAEEHRSEEEILIATAAIEERIRRGNIDDAEQRLAELAARHGASAPVAELGERLAEARARVELERGAAAVQMSEPAAAAPDAPAYAAPVFDSIYGDESRSGGGGRRFAIAAAIVVAIGAGVWWWSQRTPAGGDAASDGAPPVATDGGTAAQDTAAPVGAASGAADATRGSQLSTPPVDGGSSVAGAASGTGAAPRPVAGNPGVAAAPATDSAAAIAPGPRDVAPPAQSAAADRAPAPAPAEDRTAAAADTQSPPTAQAPETNAEAASAAPATAAAEPTTAVVVEPVAASEAPPPAAPPAAPPPPADAAPADSRASDSNAAAPADSPATAAADTQPAASTAQTQSKPAASEPDRSAIADRAPAAAAGAAPARAAAGPVLLDCGQRGVVCLKALQVPTPRYPAAARARRLTANVVVMALVDERGRVIQTHVDSGSFPFFNDAAVEAATRAVFQPATLDGVPGRSWARLTFRFDQQ